MSPFHCESAIPDRVRLVAGPYRPQKLKVGDRAFCLLRDADVVITGMSSGRIPWPRCCALHTRGGGHGLLLDEKLAQAVRTESAAALKYWFGVGDGVVARWRKALGLHRMDPLGTKVLIKAAAKKASDAATPY